MRTSLASVLRLLRVPDTLYCRTPAFGPPVLEHILKRLKQPIGCQALDILLDRDRVTSGQIYTWFSPYQNANCDRLVYIVVMYYSWLCAGNAGRVPRMRSVERCKSSIPLDQLTRCFLEIQPPGSSTRPFTHRSILYREDHGY